MARDSYRYDEGRGVSRRGCAVVMSSILFAVVVCAAGGTWVLDTVCRANADAYIPYYPGATVVSESHTLWTMFGVGRSTQILRTDDSPTKVRRWYTDQRIIAFADPSRPGELADVAYNVRPEPDTSGSLIVRSSECGV